MKFTLDTNIDDLPDDFTLEDLEIKIDLHDYYHEYERVDRKFGNTMILLNVTIDGKDHCISLVARTNPYGYLEQDVVLNTEEDNTSSFVSLFDTEKAYGAHLNPVFIEIERAAIEEAQYWFDSIWDEDYQENWRDYVEKDY